MLGAFWPKEARIALHSTQPNPEFLVFDLILEPSKARIACQGKGAVICLAGVTNLRAQTHAEVLSRNSDLALAAMRAAHAAGAGRVFVASSAAVYGAASGLLQESAALRPVSDYGIAKARMEDAALQEAHRLGQPVTMLRIGNVAGADAILGGWRPAMQIDQLPDGTTPQRSYIGPQTLAQVLHGLTRHADVPEVLNIAAEGAVQMGALLDAAGLAWESRKAPKDVIADVTLDTTLLGGLVDLPHDAGNADRLVAEWRAFEHTRTGA